MERKTTTLNFATKTPSTPRKGKISFFDFKTLKTILTLVVLENLVPWWLFWALALLCVLSSSVPLR